MPLYEHVMIARQDLSNTQAEGLIEHFGTVLADNDGKLVDSEYWGVKTMAYKINKIDEHKELPSVQMQKRDERPERGERRERR